MDRIAPTAPPPELQIRAPQLDAEKGPAATAAERRFAEHIAASQGRVLPDDVHVQLDAESQRFVAILTDSNTEETLRRYPSESQLAYSRAVMAYLRALNGPQK
ncbi:MAG TPA: hypothetical protein VEA80_12355 [Vitreimonas sp.]|uniref:hypothetical protein n=1 Tax=Vitreimonas sp. TaxID=3069702 RepID=UPI002D30CF2F|nr:hypothetical protein [Vitreimonas sp.]HYD88263.1 hypothetical protein [Vitreimonas sp.]